MSHDPCNIFDNMRKPRYLITNLGKKTMTMIGIRAVYQGCKLHLFMIHIRWGRPKKVYALGYYKSLFGAYKDKYLTSLYPSHALVSWFTFYEAWTIV